MWTSVKKDIADSYLFTAVCVPELHCIPIMYEPSFQLNYNAQQLSENSKTTTGVGVFGVMLCDSF